MKTFLIYSLILALGFWLARSTTPQVEKNDPGVVFLEEKVLYKGRPFTGDLIERYPNRVVSNQTQYLNGLKDGPSEDFSFEGKLRARWNFRQNKKHGLQEGWFLEGPKRFEFHFVDGNMDGTQLEWHVSGALFRQQSLEHGKEIDKKILYRGGEVFSNYTVRDSRIYGVDGGPLCFEPKREGQSL